MFMKIFLDEPMKNGEKSSKKEGKYLEDIR
jgi:hypothetical protein